MLPDFEGSLMFRIDGISGVAGNTTAKDMTSVFLLVSVDKTPPVLTLSAPIFYADKMTGEYQITGTADAGSKIFYGNDGNLSMRLTMAPSPYPVRWRATVVFFPFTHRTVRGTNPLCSLH